MTDRQRHGLVLLLVLGLIAGSVFVLASQPTRLGLDLQGGVELIYKAEPTAQSAVNPTSLNNAIEIMRKRVDALGVAEPQISTTGGNEITVALPNVHNTVAAEQQVGKTARLEFYDWEGNALAPNGNLVYKELQAQNPDAVTISQGPLRNGSAVGSAAAGGMSLYDAVKLASQQPRAPYNRSLSRLGDQYYLFGAPGSQACKTAAADAGTIPQFGEHCLLAQPAASPAQLSLPAGVKLSDGQLLKVPQGTVVLQAVPQSFTSWPSFGSSTTRYFVLKDRVALFGNEITNPVQSTDQFGNPDVAFGFTGQGGGAFQQVTRTIAQRGAATGGILGSGVQNNQHFAIALDNQLVSVPYIDYNQFPDGIPGDQGAEISGGFTGDTASQLATELRLGALPIRLVRISEQSVSATLGKQALQQGLLAGAAGLLIVALFLLVFYRVLGLIAIAGLAIYGLYFYALIKLIPVTMTLAGIAGLILTIGVAADANIVIFERVKEEIRGGRSIRQGIVTGYRKGLTAIIDANVVTIMTAFILFVLATADVKGFAFTLGLGTFVSLFTAVIVTQSILTTMGSSRLISRPSMLGAGGRKRAWRFDFMGASRYFFTMSGVILLIGALAIGGRGLNLGIDFTSGTRVSVGLVHQATVPQIRTIMSQVGSGDATVQRVTGSPTLGPVGFQISSKYLSGSQQDHLRSLLQSRFQIRTSGTSQDFNLTSIGPTFGSQIAHSAVIAIIASLIVISIYVALRFDWKFAVPVLIALMHDLLITSGVYALTGREVTTDTVAALLTILGYSMYDTIIVFDRVRENIPRMPRAAFSQIVNRSMSEVLTRSLATTTVTLLPVVALLLFGGSTLKDFAFALLIGVASGAYSSIFIASPVLTHWKEREPVYRSRRAHMIADYGSVPAYADSSADVDPSARRLARTGRLSSPDSESVSAAEFEQMKRDLGLDEEPVSGGRTSRLSRRLAHSDGEATATTAAPQGTRPADGPRQLPQRPGGRRPLPQKPGSSTATPPRTPQSGGSAPPAPPPSDPGAGGLPPDPPPAPDVAENEGMVPRDKPSGRPKRSRNRRHGRR